MRVRRMIVTVLAVITVATATGCSSSEDGQDGQDGDDRQRLAQTRTPYCEALGKWQDTMRAEGAKTPGSPAYEKIGPAAERVYAAARPHGDEHVTGGRTLAEETSLAIRYGDAEAEIRVTAYCVEAGLETLVG
ncbi:hypothetical protein [Streptomyces sp. NPDC085529]|uniref:hypothetical protein n=1 Tax=Streptomyces sp. NPDC085529 TaxID=3365729 RepID=UPI0037D34C7D